MFMLTKIPQEFGKLVPFKTLFWSYSTVFYENNVIRVCKINWPINQLIITDINTAKMCPIKPFQIVN